MRETFAAMDDETNGQWKVTPKKYVNGWAWSATAGDTVLTNSGVLFATETEARIDANAAIARHEKEATK
jgi:hypothetical protein